MYYVGSKTCKIVAEISSVMVVHGTEMSCWYAVVAWMSSIDKEHLDLEMMLVLLTSWPKDVIFA